jgi:hypothetical protein
LLHHAFHEIGTHVTHPPSTTLVNDGHENELFWNGTLLSQGAGRSMEDEANLEICFIERDDYSHYPRSNDLIHDSIIPQRDPTSTFSLAIPLVCKDLFCCWRLVLGGEETFFVATCLHWQANNPIRCFGAYVASSCYLLALSLSATPIRDAH